jgi:hypothetical protein
MRGPDQPQTSLFSYVSVEDQIPADHPLRAIQSLVNPILVDLSPRFECMYSKMGRPSRRHGRAGGCK